MSEIFIKILNMSITASWLILAVFLTRLLLKKAPKWIVCILWGLVAIRLISPVSFESVFSLIPSRETIPVNIGMQPEPAINSGITIVNEAVNPVLSESFTPDPAQSINPLQIVINVAAVIWIAGMVIMLTYAFVSYIKLKKKVAVCVPAGDRIFACDEVKTPFILGMFSPNIFVPSNLTGKTLDQVIRHEKAHLQRHDHWWKPLGFLLLSVYWFNPLCWIAYILLCRDIEMACDEKVIRGMDKDDMAAYSQALLDCSFPRKKIAACPLAFGEVGVKERVKGVLNYKRPAFWIILIAIIACAAVAVLLMTDPFSNNKLSGKLGPSMDMAVFGHNLSSRDKDNNIFAKTDYDVLLVSKSGNTTTVYAKVFYEEYSFDGTDVKVETSSNIPTAVTFDTSSADSDYDSATYEVIEYWEPRDGSYYSDDIREKFPWSIRDKAFDNSDFTDHHEKFLQLAREHFGIGQGIVEDDSYNYYLTVGADNIKTITVKTQNTGGGCRNADDSLFKKGEQIWLESLAGRRDLRGVTITAIDTDEKVIWTETVPDTEDYMGLTCLEKDGWMITNFSDSNTAEYNIDYELADTAVYFTSTPFKAWAGEKVEIRTDILYDSDIHVYADGKEINKTHSDSDYWEYSFIMPDGNVSVTASFYTKDEVLGTEKDDYDNPVIATAVLDIDGDGAGEELTMTFGPTSGLFTAVFTASVQGKIKYKNTFNLSNGHEFYFSEKDGVPQLVRDGEYHRLHVEDGHIVIDGLDPEYEGYWGWADPDWNY